MHPPKHHCALHGCLTDKKGLVEIAALRRIHFIYERCTRKFKADLDLWLRWIAFCKASKSNKQMSKVGGRASCRRAGLHASTSAAMPAPCLGSMHGAYGGARGRCRSYEAAAWPWRELCTISICAPQRATARHSCGGAMCMRHVCGCRWSLRRCSVTPTCRCYGWRLRSGELTIAPHRGTVNASTGDAEQHDQRRPKHRAAGRAVHGALQGECLGGGAVQENWACMHACMQMVAACCTIMECGVHMRRPSLHQHPLALPCPALVWSGSACREFEAHSNMTAARTLMQQGLRMCKGDADMWLEYFRFELLYAAKLRARRELMGIGNAAGGAASQPASRHALRCAALHCMLTCQPACRQACTARPGQPAGRPAQHALLQLATPSLMC